MPRPAPPTRTLALLGTLAAGCTCGAGDAPARGAPDDPAAVDDAPARPAGPTVAPAGHRLVDVAASGPRGVRWLTAGADGRGRLCEATQPSRVGVALGVVRCADLDPALAVGADARVVPAAEANAPALVLVPGRGLVARDGTRWLAPPVRAAEGAAGEAVAVTEARGVAADGEPGATRLVRVALEGGDETARTPLPVAPSSLRAGPVVLRGVVWWVADGPDGPRLERAGDDGTVARVGPALDGAEALSACRGPGEVDALVVDGARDVEAGSRAVRVVFVGGDAGPRAAAGTVGLDAGPPACATGEVTFQWVAPLAAGVDPRPVGHELRCRPGGCAPASSPLGIAGTDPAPTEFAGRTLLAWTASDGTRVRLAPLPVLEGAADLDVLSDGAGAPAWRRWIVRAGGALLLEGRPGGVVAHRFDTTGDHARVDPGDW